MSCIAFRAEEEIFGGALCLHRKGQSQLEGECGSYHLDLGAELKHALDSRLVHDLDHGSMTAIVFSKSTKNEVQLGGYILVVHAKNVTPCNAISPLLFLSTSSPFTAFSKTSLALSLSVPSSTATWLSVLIRFQSASSSSQTVHLTVSSPKGSEKRGIWPVSVCTMVCRGVGSIWASKTACHFSSLNRGCPSAAMEWIQSFRVCSHFVVEGQEDGLLSADVTSSMS
jgi:hypothetical protein